MKPLLTALLCLSLPALARADYRQALDPRDTRVRFSVRLGSETADGRVGSLSGSATFSSTSHQLASVQLRSPSDAVEILQASPAAMFLMQGMLSRFQGQSASFESRTISYPDANKVSVAGVLTVGSRRQALTLLAQVVRADAARTIFRGEFSDRPSGAAADLPLSGRLAYELAFTNSSPRT